MTARFKDAPVALVVQALAQLVYHLVHSIPTSAMQLQPIDSREAKADWSNFLRRVRAGEAFTITERGVPVAELIPTAANRRRTGAEAAAEMRVFMRSASNVTESFIKAAIQEGRD